MHSYDMAQIVLREHFDSEINAEDLKLLCRVCDKRSAILRWDENYAGYRGRCSLCEYDWPES
jgi:hypothetical protein